MKPIDAEIEIYIERERGRRKRRARRRKRSQKPRKIQRLLIENTRIQYYGGP